MTNVIALLQFIVCWDGPIKERNTRSSHRRTHKSYSCIDNKNEEEVPFLLLLRRHCLFIKTLHHTVVTSVDTVAKGPPASTQETIGRDDTKWVIKIANKGRRVSPIRGTKIKRNFPAAKRGHSFVSVFHFISH